ncbi:MAG: class II glutamine amidotransferase [Calditrichia bacterium]
MCRLFFQSSKKIEDATGWLLSYENSLFHQSMTDETNRPNADGWGLGWLDESHSFRVKKSSKPAFLDPEYKYTSQSLKSNLILGHIRRASVGEINLHNAHPFQFGRFLFIHNGNIPSFKKDPEFIYSKISNDLKSYIKGTTDSEAVFYYFLSHILHLDPVQEKDQVIKTLSDMILYLLNYDLSDKQYFNALNFFLSTPEITFGFRFNKSLYYFNDPDKILIASEPIKDYNIWKEIDDESLFVVVNNRIEFYPIHQLIKIKV